MEIDEITSYILVNSSLDLFKFHPETNILFILFFIPLSVHMNKLVFQCLVGLAFFLVCCHILLSLLVVSPNITLFKELCNLI